MQYGDQAEMAALIEKRARALSFGQNTASLYEREDSSKRWRAEYPATPEEKREASQRLLLFKEAVGDMSKLKLHELFIMHEQNLVRRYVQCGGRGKERVELGQRLAAVRASQASLAGLAVVHQADLVIDNPGRYFLTYVRDEPVGTKTKMKMKPRLQPYAVGRMHGAPLSVHVCSPGVASCAPRDCPSPLPTRACHRCANHVCTARDVRGWGCWEAGDPVGLEGDAHRL